MDKPEYIKGQKAPMARFGLSWHNLRDTATRQIQAAAAKSAKAAAARRTYPPPGRLVGGQTLLCC